MSPEMVVILFTARILAGILFFNLIAGTIAGVYLARRKNRITRSLEVLISLPLVFPPIAMGFFLLLLLGRSGIFGFILGFLDISIVFTPGGVFLASLISGFPLMVKSVKTVAMGLERSMLEMARIQGATLIQILIYIVLPNIRTGILSGLALSAGRSLGEVGITLMLGGNIAGKTETLSLAIYNAVFEGAFGQAAFLSLVLGMGAAAMFGMLQKIEQLDAAA